MVVVFLHLTIKPTRSFYALHCFYTFKSSVLNGESKNYQIIHRRNEVKIILNSKINVGRVGALSKAPQ